MARPRNSCVHAVKRFASEYQNTIASATGDSRKHKGLKRDAANTNRADAATTNAAASPRDMTPRGNSRFAVRGLSASNRASTRRLNPIAALRAATIATRIQTIVPTVTGTCWAASSAPASANGSAKTEWLKRTNEAYVRMRENNTAGSRFKVQGSRFIRST